MLKANFNALQGWRKQGEYYRGPCPIHGGKDSLQIKETTSGSVLLHCHAGCDWKEVRDKLIEMGCLHTTNSPNKYYRSTQTCEEKIEWCKNQVSQCSDVIPDRWKGYFIYRGIRAEVIDKALKTGKVLWNPRKNCLMNLFEDASREITGFQQVVVTERSSGIKPFDVQRRFYGIAKGSAIKLFKNKLDDGMAIAEGVETSMSFFQIYGIPTWAVGSSNGIKNFKPCKHGLKPGKRILVAADFDGAGISAYEHFKRVNRNYDIKMALPKTYGKDWNDVIR